MLAATLQADKEEYPQEDRNVCHVYRSHGPWTCPSCGGKSWKPYRCNVIVSHRDGEPITCGKDLVAADAPERIR